MKSPLPLPILTTALMTTLTAGFTLNCAADGPRSRVATHKRVSTENTTAELPANQTPQEASAPLAQSNAQYFLNLSGTPELVSEADTEPLIRDRVVLFTEPLLGRFPKLWNGQWVNGGTPVQANMVEHLKIVKRDVENAIPDPLWDGYAVIDYESWYLLWEYMPEHYRERTRDVVRAENPSLTTSQLEEASQVRWEKAAFDFLTKTIDLCKELRPHAKWGYYGYPRSPRPERFNRVRPLFDHVTAFYPSIYAKHWSVESGPIGPGQAKLKLYTNRIADLVNTLKGIAEDRPVIVYTWRSYNSANAVYGRKPLNDVDIHTSLTHPLEVGADGVIIWEVVRTPMDAATFVKDLKDRMLPIVRERMMKSNADNATEPAPAPEALAPVKSIEEPANTSGRRRASQL